MHHYLYVDNGDSHTNLRGLIVFPGFFKAKVYQGVKGSFMAVRIRYA